MQAGLARVGVDAAVRVSGSFVETVNSLTGSTQYSADRGAGTVGARTLNLVDGPLVVINWDAAQDLDNAALERLLAHESGHVLLYPRGEHASPWQSLAGDEADWQLLCVASYALEEYRVERGVTEVGYPPSDAATPEHLSDALTELNAQVVRAVTLTDGADEMRRIILSAQDVFTKVLAYTAGAGGTIDTANLDDAAAVHWSDYVETSWPARLDLYGSVPDAWTPMTADSWEDALRAGIELEREFLASLGFSYQAEGDALAFRRTGADQLFEQRLQRLRDDAEAEE